MAISYLFEKIKISGPIYKSLNHYSKKWFYPNGSESALEIEPWFYCSGPGSLKGTNSCSCTNENTSLNKDGLTCNCNSGFEAATGGGGYNTGNSGYYYYYYYNTGYSEYNTVCSGMILYIICLKFLIFS